MLYMSFLEHVEMIRLFVLNKIIVFLWLKGDEYFQYSKYYDKTLSFFIFMGNTDMIILVIVTQVTLSFSVLFCTHTIKEEEKMALKI